jgi:hypothetical protein
MNEKPDTSVTAGELRRRLAAMGDPWTVDPRLADDEVIQDRPRGGLSDEPALESLSPDVDLTELLQAQPPANPELRARWREVGLLPDETESGAGS